MREREILKGPLTLAACICAGLGHFEAAFITMGFAAITSLKVKW